jgi:type IV pilus assembly protein PilB
MASAINIALAQRLVRRLCPHCRKESPIEGEIKTLIEKTLESIVDKKEIPTMPKNIFIPGGCDKCNQTGYKGRIGIYEGIKITPEVASIIDMNPNEEEIMKAAAPQGLLTMKQDGVIKILKGITSFEELERVITIGE